MVNNRRLQYIRFSVKKETIQIARHEKETTQAAA